MTFKGHVNNKNIVIYRTGPVWSIMDWKKEETLGILALQEGWQDADRTYTAQDIYWEDKYDCISMLKEVQLAA